MRNIYHLVISVLSLSLGSMSAEISFHQIRFRPTAANGTIATLYRLSRSQIGQISSIVQRSRTEFDRHYDNSPFVEHHFDLMAISLGLLLS
jgi:hypothetical protein